MDTSPPVDAILRPTNSYRVMDLSIVIVSWNAKRFLKECLESLVSNSVKIEIIVVDNCSSDGSPEMVESSFPGIKLIRNDWNLGFARANNQGIRASKGRYIALVNSDVKFVEDCFSTLVRYMDEHSDVGVVGPRMLEPDMTVQPSCRRFPSLWNNFCEAARLHRIFPQSRLFSAQHMRFFPHDTTRDVDVLAGCFWLVRRETFEAVGLLDEEFFIYSEDVDWCKRCWKAGWRVVFFAGTQAIHYRAGSSANDPVRFALEQQKSVLRYWRKHHGRLASLAIRVILLGKHLGRLVSQVGRRSCATPGLWQSNGHWRASVACIQALFLHPGADRTEG